MDQQSGLICVEDVYDLASAVGKEFEKIIDSLGSDSVSTLMPKVIRVLEHLEVLTLRKDDADNDMDKLKMHIWQLEHDKHERAEQHIKYEKEIESIEENWQKENIHLEELIDKLKSDNRILTKKLIDNETTLSQSLTELRSEYEMKDNSELIALKESINRSNKKIETLSKDVESKNEEIEKLYEQMESVMQQNRDLKRRVKNLQSQTRHLTEEKADLQLLFQEHSKELTSLNDNLKNATIDTVDQSKSRYDRQVSAFDGSQRNSRFTLGDLRTIIMEKNDLKSRVRELEEEIIQTKNTNATTAVRKHSRSTQSRDPTLSDEDLPVQGPINREPEEKLFPRTKYTTKILRFFPSLNWQRLKVSNIV